MIIYLVKFILCSGLFFTAYALLLEKEKAHQFKRFYLLSSLGLSLIIPLLTFQHSPEIMVKGAETYFNIYNEKPVSVNTIQIVEPQESNIYPYLIVGLYVCITLILCLRFTRNFYNLLAKVRKSCKSTWRGTNLILNANDTPPYSFINYIFVSKLAYENKQIPDEILLHELTHIQQKHSLDVIFIELMQIFFWFNPILIYYRRAIQTNHEYLADENVINNYQDISAYQMVLLNHISTQNGLTLTSPFNYLTTKKRLTMMTKTTTMKVVLGKQLLLIPVLGLALFLFSIKTEAQEKSLGVVKQTSTIDGLSSTEQKEFDQLYSKYHPTPKLNEKKIIKLEEKDMLRLAILYKKMNNEQQKKSNVFLFDLKPLKSGPPSNTQLADWKNAEKYGVWIDGKKVENEKLTNYSESDFGLWTSSRLSKKAKNYGKYYFQIDLMTKAKYQAYYKEAMEKNKPQAFFVNHN